MSWIQLILKEVGLQLAFIVIGALLLLSCWISQNLNRDVLAEFSQNRLSLVADSLQEDELRTYLEQNEEVIEFEVQNSSSNKDKLSNIYPELKNVLEPLEEKYFPISATVTVKAVEPFLSLVKNELPSLQAFVIHEAPAQLQAFLGLSFSIFFVLWIFTLGLFLFFQVENLAHRDSEKWSLMKMLGSKPSLIFWPMCWQQLLRVLASSGVAIFGSYWAAREFESLFQWGWEPVAIVNWVIFLGISLTLALGVFIGLFVLRFRKVPLG